MSSKDVSLKSKGSNLFGAVGSFCVKFRWLILIIWIVGAFFVIHYLPSLSNVTQSDNSAFLPNNSPSEKAIKLASAFGKAESEPVPVVIATTDNSPLTQSDQMLISRLATSLSHVTGVVKVQNGGLSADGVADELVVLAGAKASSGGEDPTPFISSLRTAITNAGLPNNLQAHLAGDVATAVDNSKKSGATNNQLQLGVAIFIIILLLVIFRAPLAPLITLLPPFIIVFISGPIIAEAANHGLKVSSLAQLLLTVLVLGAGTDYGLFLIFRVREEMLSGTANRPAIVKALSRVGESITFSAATVIAALLSLTLATFQIYSDLGVPLAIGVGLMLLAGLTLLPALLAIFGRAVFWPMRKSDRPSRFGLWGRICAKVVARPVTVLIVGILVFGSLALAVPGYKAGGFGGTTTSPSGSDSAKGNSLLASHFPSSSANPTEILYKFNYSVWSNPQILATLQSKTAAIAQFKTVMGPLNLNGRGFSPAQLTSLYRQLGSPASLPTQPSASVLSDGIAFAAYEQYRLLSNLISPDGHTVQYLVSLRAGDPGSTTAMAQVPAIRAAVTNAGNSAGAESSGVAGEAPVLYDIDNISNSDLKRVVPVAILVIGILLGILMRSLIAPLYLIASVALSYLASLGLAVLLFIDIGHGSGLIFILPFLMFIFLLALGEDYNILVMTRIREEAHGLPLRKAVPKALNTTGTTVTSAGLVLAGTFAVFAIVGGAGGGGSEVRDIGFGLAAGIVMDTFLVRTLLVPSVVVLLGKWNWWPTKHGSWVSEDD